MRSTSHRYYTPEERAEWERLFQAGNSIAKIAYLTGGANTTIYDHLKRRGFDTRRTFANKGTLIDAAIRMHGEGVALKEITERLGLPSRRALWSLLDRAGVRLYRRGPLAVQDKPSQPRKIVVTPEEREIRRQTMREYDLYEKRRRLRLEQDGRAACINRAEPQSPLAPPLRIG